MRENNLVDSHIAGKFFADCAHDGVATESGKAVIDESGHTVVGSLDEETFEARLIPCVFAAVCLKECLEPLGIFVATTPHFLVADSEKEQSVAIFVGEVCNIDIFFFEAVHFIIDEQLVGINVDIIFDEAFGTHHSEAFHSANARHKVFYEHFFIGKREQRSFAHIEARDTKRVKTATSLDLSKHFIATREIFESGSLLDLHQFGIASSGVALIVLKLGDNLVFHLIKRAKSTSTEFLYDMEAIRGSEWQRNRVNRSFKSHFLESGNHATCTKPREFTSIAFRAGIFAELFCKFLEISAILNESIDTIHASLHCGNTFGILVTRSEEKDVFGKHLTLGSTVCYRLYKMIAIIGGKHLGDFALGGIPCLIFKWIREHSATNPTDVTMVALGARID